MKVFVTGASGFVGSAIVKELLRAGHQVRGLVRSDKATEELINTGAEAHRGDIYDLNSLKSGTVDCDAIIHTAFNHDFSKFKENCETDRKVITALGEALTGSEKPLIVTSGIGLINKDGIIIETDSAPGSDIMPRAASEEAAHAVAAKGVNTYIVRLPPTVHGKDDHGFIPILINTANEKKESVYTDEGLNRWPAVHRLDAAVLYRLIIEKQPDQKVFHAVAEEGVPFKEIAAAIGKGLGLPVVSKSKTDAAAHFGWFAHFASFNCAASSEQTCRITGWQPKQQSLLQDLVPGIYF